MIENKDLRAAFYRHRWPLRIMTGLVATTVCACLVLVSTTSLTAKPKPSANFAQARPDAD
ncbi:MAG: hypothetical protein AAFR50_01615 [Pseudomonadota bacterium]